MPDLQTLDAATARVAITDLTNGGANPLTLPFTPNTDVVTGGGHAGCGVLDVCGATLSVADQALHAASTRDAAIATGQISDQAL